MPRPLRVEFPGAIYHVMCRGNRQEAIFKDTTDQEIFLKTLGDACTRCGWKVHAYVLMGNHYHLLLETPEANLVEGMRWFQGVYTQRFNARHTLWGHLFQGRYKALLVDGGGEYFSTVARYIHLNPARARCFDLEDGTLSDYKPSSYIAYLHPAVRPEWLVVDRGLRSCGYDDTETGRAGYRDYMQKRVTEILHSDNPSMADAAWQSIRRGWIFGSEEFCSQMRDEIDRAAKGCRRDSHSGGAVLLHDEQAAEELLKTGLKVVGLDVDDLDGLRKNDDRKKVVAWLIRKNSTVKNEWVSSALKMGNMATVSRSIRAVDEAVDGILFELKAKMSKIKD